MKDIRNYKGDWVLKMGGMLWLILKDKHLSKKDKQEALEEIKLMVERDLNKILRQ